MPSAKVVSNSASKSFGTQNASKSSESFSIQASAIPISLTTLTSVKNVQEAIERVSSQTAVAAAAPSAPEEGDIWYDTDDDKLYIRDEDSWNELVSSISGTVDGGSF